MSVETFRRSRGRSPQLLTASPQAVTRQLEEAVDACENAADVLEAILVKNR